MSGMPDSATTSRRRYLWRELGKDSGEMTAAKAHAKAVRSVETRERILVVAERLYAELGVFAVSNRQVSEAAGQGNNAAVGYHFGTKADLVRAIVAKHTEQIETTRRRLLVDFESSESLRDGFTCLVRPSTDHLAALGNPTWYARFSAQVLTDPSLRSIMYEQALAAPSLQKTISMLRRCLPDLPADVRSARGDMARTLMTHVIADRERLFAETGSDDPVSEWYDCGTDLIDALVGLWQAPVSR